MCSEMSSLAAQGKRLEDSVDGGSGGWGLGQRVSGVGRLQFLEEALLDLQPGSPVYPSPIFLICHLPCWSLTTN